MILKGLLWLLLTVSLLHDLAANPIQFPEDSEQVVGPLAHLNAGDAQPKFHHGLVQKHKKKKRKRKKLGCRYRDADPKAEGRFFFYPLINYYDTDIHVYNGLYGNRPGALGGSGGIIDPCSSLISGGGSIISGVGSILTGSSGGRPPPPTTAGSGPVTGGGGDNGDNTDEDYDYSDGGDSDSSSSGNGGSGLGSGSVISNAPAAVSNILSSVNNSIRPIFARPNRYLDYYVVRPFNRGVSQLLNWF